MWRGLFAHLFFRRIKIDAKLIALWIWYHFEWIWYHLEWNWILFVCVCAFIFFLLFRRMNSRSKPLVTDRTTFRNEIYAKQMTCITVNSNQKIEYHKPMLLCQPIKSTIQWHQMKNEFIVRQLIALNRFEKTID